MVHTISKLTRPFFSGCQNGFSDPVFQRLYSEGYYDNQEESSLTALSNLLSKATNPLQMAKLLYYASTIKKSRAWISEISGARFRTWEELHLLRKHWPGKILLKGIQGVKDARKAAEMKDFVDGIIVSNHGGRQVDGAIASLDALEMIMQDDLIRQSGMTVLFDSGVRTGSDILKAVALGAQGVLIGR
jgi:lactate 2-monooxygenase